MPSQLLVKKPSLLCANLLLALSLGSRVELPVVDTPKWFQWKISTFTLPETSMPLGLPITCLQLWLTTTFTMEMSWASILVGLPGNGWSTWTTVNSAILSMAFKEKQTGFLVKMALTSQWLLKSWLFSVSQKISLTSKNASIASLLGTTTKDNQSQLKTSRLEVLWQPSSKMPSIQTWYKP